jgi:ribosomal protein L19E
MEPLEYEPNPSPIVNELRPRQPRDLLRVNAYGAGIRSIHRADQVKEGRLTGSGRANDGHESPRTNRKVNFVKRDEFRRSRRVALRETRDLDLSALRRLTKDMAPCAALTQDLAKRRLSQSMRQVMV